MFEQVLGIVLDSDKVNLCLVNKGIKFKELLVSHSESIPDDLRDKGARQIGEFLKALCADKQIQPDIIYSALPCSASMFRYIHLPFTDINKISKVYPYEVEQTLPCPMNEVVMDYQIIKSANDSGTDILVAILPLKALEEHLEILRFAGLEPHVTTLDSTGLLFLNNILFKKKDRTKYGILDLNHKKATLLITQSNRILLNRKIELSDINNLCHQIYLTLASYPANNNLHIEKITLTGNQQQTLKLANLIKDEIHIKTDFLYSYKMLPIKIKGSISGLSPFFAAPFGLCMAKRFKKSEVWNFRQGHYACQKTYKLPHQISLLLNFIILLIIIVAGLNLKVRSEYYKNRVGLLEKEAQNILDQILPGTAWGPETLSTLKKKIEKQSIIQKKYADFIAQDINTLDILRELSIRIPIEYEVQIQEVLFQDGQIRIKGKTETFEILEKLKTSLGKSKIFQDITVEEANIRGKGNQVSFNLILSLKST